MIYSRTSNNYIFLLKTFFTSLGFIILSTGLFGQNNYAKTLRFKPEAKTITFDKNGFPLDYHYITSPDFSLSLVKHYRWQHLQDMLRLPDYNGKKYYMGTYSQNVADGGISNVGEVITDDEDGEGGMVFVAELEYGSNHGRVIWVDTLNNDHSAGGFNHPCDLRLMENVVVIAGQNWDGGDWAIKGEDAAKANASKVGQQFADAMKEGNGGDAVLFYDVSDPTRSNYMGKLNSFLKNGNRVDLKLDIDQILITKLSDGNYNLLINGLEEDNGILLKSTVLSPEVEWEWENDRSPISASVVHYYNPNKERSYAAVTPFELKGDDKQWMRYFTNNGEEFFERIPKPGFNLNTDGATINLTTQTDGTSHLVIANVESNEVIQIKELESEKWSHPITNLYFIAHEDEVKPSVPDGFELIPFYLNKGNEGDYIYLCYTRDPTKGEPITNIVVRNYEDGPEDLGSITPTGYNAIANNRNLNQLDLNKGAGGKYIYMFFTRSSDYDPITSLDIVEGENSSIKKGWIRIDSDLNEGTPNSTFMNLFIPTAHLSEYLIYTREKIAVELKLEPADHILKEYYQIGGTEDVQWRYYETDDLWNGISKNLDVFFHQGFLFWTRRKISVHELTNSVRAELEAEFPNPKFLKMDLTVLYYAGEHKLYDIQIEFEGEKIMLAYERDGTRVPYDYIFTNDPGSRLEK